MTNRRRPTLRALLPVIMSALILSACAGPETRVRTALVDAGVRRPVAQCMAKRMVDRLSIGQLRKLSQLAKLRQSNEYTKAPTLDQVLAVVRKLDDPEILTVVSSSGLICFARDVLG